MPLINSDNNSVCDAVGCALLGQPANLPWYALQIRSKLGNVALATLCGKGYEAYLPVYRSERRWSDRLKQLDIPLFPGYLFCRFEARNRLPILTTPGVIGVVGAGKTPVRVNDEEIEAIRAILDSGLAAQPWPFLSVGSRIYMEAGPLAGLEGTISNADKTCRLVVSVSLLQRSVAVEIDRDWARPILPDTGRPCHAGEREAPAFRNRSAN